MAFKIGIIGTGYVGIVSGTTFAETGNEVICVDIDEAKIEKMRKGISPIYEPGLERLMVHNIEENRLKFTSNLKDAVLNCEIIFLCLPTPPDADGSADLRFVLNVSRDIANIIKEESITDRKIIVDKSTVPVGTSEKVSNIFAEVLGNENNVFVCSNPEFLREGYAVEDAMKPERVVIGTSSNWVGERMKDLYKPFLRSGNPIYVMDEKSAEVTKYAANSFLATKISFMNDLSAYCEVVGADIDSIRLGIGSDSRIGKRFLFAGLGYGGSCFPKDVQALNFSADQNNSELLIVKATEEINQKQTLRFIDKIITRFNGDLEGKTIAIWGLAFKPHTDDVRDAPAFKVIQNMLDRGANVRVFDQEAIDNTKLKFGDKIYYSEDMYDCLKDADALVICTEWSVFRTPNFDKIKSSLKNQLIFDGRNVYETKEMEELGFEYYSIGRKVINKK
jgi:UDPglucose 6-dehydrogenase